MCSASSVSLVVVMVLGTLLTAHWGLGWNVDGLTFLPCAQS